MSIKDLEITLNYINQSWLPHSPKLNRNLSLIYKSTKKTGILLWKGYLKNLNLNLILTLYLTLNLKLSKKLYKKLKIN